MRQIVKLFFFCAVFLTCSLPTAATEYVGGFPYHTRLSPAERSRMEAIGAIEGGLAPFIWGIVGSCIILFLRPRRRRYWITFFLFAGLGMWFLLFWPATKGDTSSPNEDKVSATISINNYIKTTYAHLLFQMEKDFKKMKPVRSERRKCVSHHYHK